MPSFLQKKRRASTSAIPAAEDAEDKQHHPVSAVVELRPSPPSPSSSRTTFSRSSLSFSLPSTPKRKGTGESGSSGAQSKQNGGSSTTSLGLKLTPIKSKVVNKVKRQIQRLDNALHQVTSGGSRRGGSEDAEEDAEKPSKARSRLHPATIFPPRQRTLSTHQPNKLRKPPRNRTISCPVVFEPPPTMASEESSLHRTPSLSPLQEESAATRAAEGLDPSASDVFGGPVPAVHVEEDVPDPFLVDEEGDALSSEEGSSSPSRQSVSPAAAHDVSLSISPTPSPLPDLATKPLPTPTTPNVHKDVPPPPVSDDDEDEDEVPELYLPGLVIPAMFLPIPNVRRSFCSNLLTWWLSRSRLTVI